jgi:hypothetical protein
VSWQHRVIETKQLYIIIFSSNVTELPKIYPVVMPYEQNNREHAYVCTYMHISMLCASACM